MEQTRVMCEQNLEAQVLNSVRFFWFLSDCLFEEIQDSMVYKKHAVMYLVLSIYNVHILTLI